MLKVLIIAFSVENPARNVPSDVSSRDTRSTPNASSGLYFNVYNILQFARLVVQIMAGASSVAVGGIENKHVEL